MRKAARRGKRLSMTSLIDVIFLLLLFFMLSSTFSKFSEVELTAAGQSSGARSDSPPLFLQLAESDLRLNGQNVTLESLAATLSEQVSPDAGAGARQLLVSLGQDVTAQRLTDLLVTLRGVAGITPTVLGSAS